MNRYARLGTLVLTLSLLSPGAAYGAVTDYQTAVKEQKNAVVQQIDDHTKEGTKMVLVKDTLYVSGKEAVLRSEPYDKGEEISELELGDEVSRVGICENGWSKVLVKKKEEQYTGYMETVKLAEDVEIQTTDEELEVIADAQILDFPSIRDGEVLGEVIEMDEVTRIGICNEVWSKIRYMDIDGEEITGYIPTEALETADIESSDSGEETGALSPSSGEGIFAEAVDGVTSDRANGKSENGVLIGEAIPVSADAKLKPMGVFKITHYCPCSLCCGPWSDGITSTGVTAVTNRTIAVDPKQIPYGSKVVINGQVYVAEDCGGAITENCIDIYVASHEEGNEKGVYYTDVFILEE